MPGDIGGGDGQRFRVRAGEPLDAQAIAAIHVDAWRVAYEGVVPASFLAGLSPPRRAAEWRERLSIARGPDFFVDVAVDEADTPVGFVSGGGSRDPDRKSFGELYALYVAPGRLRRGIGRLLVEAALAEMAEAFFAGVTLWLLEGSVAAQRFLLASGWHAEEATRDVELGTALVPARRYARSC